jgi:hypothetical protein
MARLRCVTTCRRWEGLRRRVMDGETLLCDNMQEMERSEEESEMVTLGCVKTQQMGRSEKTMTDGEAESGNV